MTKKLVEGADFYYNEEGLIVLTELYHLKKGYCCGNGCKHCPFDYKHVDEPLKQELLDKRRIKLDDQF
ncbi:MAG: DUF5522 domain-containing protein [Chitinophagaceae bacterium]